MLFIGSWARDAKTLFPNTRVKGGRCMECAADKGNKHIPTDVNRHPQLRSDFHSAAFLVRRIYNLSATEKDSDS